MACLFCGTPAILNVRWSQFHAVMCRDCVIGCDIGAICDVEDKKTVYSLGIKIDDVLHPMIIGISDPIELARSADDAIQYFDHMKDIAFEIANVK